MDDTRSTIFNHWATHHTYTLKALGYHALLCYSMLHHLLFKFIESRSVSMYVIYGIKMFVSSPTSTKHTFVNLPTMYPPACLPTRSNWCRNVLQSTHYAALTKNSFFSTPTHFNLPSLISLIFLASVQLLKLLIFFGKIQKLRTSQICAKKHFRKNQIQSICVYSSTCSAPALLISFFYTFVFNQMHESPFTLSPSLFSTYKSSSRLFMLCVSSIVGISSLNLSFGVLYVSSYTLFVLSINCPYSARLSVFLINLCCKDFQFPFRIIVCVS